MFCKSSTKNFPLKSASRACGIFRYTEDLVGDDITGYTLNQSELATNCLNSNSRKLSWPIMLLAIDGRWPPARVLPILVSGCGNTVVHGIALFGVVTVTYMYTCSIKYLMYVIHSQQ